MSLLDTPRGYAIIEGMTNPSIRSGAQIRNRRLALGLTQSELGERAGVPAPIVSYVETGLASAEHKIRGALLDAELERYVQADQQLQQVQEAV